MKMNRNTVVTAKMLRIKNACEDQAAIFEREWPKGAQPTLKNIRRATELDLNDEWFAKTFLDAAAGAAYEKARDAAWVVYKEATAAAWVAYKKARAAAWVAYKKAMAAAWVAYKEATAAALVAAIAKATQ